MHLASQASGVRSRPPMTPLLTAREENPSLHVQISGGLSVVLSVMPWYTPKATNAKKAQVPPYTQSNRRESWVITCSKALGDGVRHRVAPWAWGERPAWPSVGERCALGTCRDASGAGECPCLRGLAALRPDPSLEPDANIDPRLRPGSSERPKLHKRWGPGLGESGSPACGRSLTLPSASRWSGAAIPLRRPGRAVTSR
jgi:hypothetical protein